MIDKLHFITQENEHFTHLSAMEEALKNGVRWVQLRIKNRPVAEVEAQAWEARRLCNKYSARLIINDHPTIASLIKADGVHLGKEDMSVVSARKILGTSKIIGATANTLEDIIEHNEAGADYIGLGPFRFTTTKEKLSPTLGLEGYRTILSKCSEHNINIPIIAIGGITITDIPALIGAGVHGIAASSMIINAQDMLQTTQTIFDIVKQPIDYANNS
ncbi:thiamine phosphate synthase [Fulvivirga sp. 29W222]|uniref:Thiamine-phosphate synthase n=1 Tax=Fulvivirga marina TaxID=2494733 RepID=A0A937KAZ3_9BACT|nr:thiamine phosphate synthase [Fulvivirga marina]MBL6445159.1 thiamine phosphate synthase [Fulvivirga marina]